MHRGMQYRNMQLLRDHFGPEYDVQVRQLQKDEPDEVALDIVSRDGGIFGGARLLTVLEMGPGSSGNWWFMVEPARDMAAAQRDIAMIRGLLEGRP